MMDLDVVFSIPISLLATTTLAAVVILAIVVLIHGRKRSSYHPVGGSIFLQRKNMHRIQDFIIDVARKHKTYRFPGFLGSTSQVLTVDPVNVEYMLKTNYVNYGQRWSKTLVDLLGEGIFNVNGEKWHHQRKLTSYEFSTKTLRDFSNIVSKTNAIKLARILADQAVASNRSIDIQDLFEKATLDSTFKIIVGVELDVMCGTFEEGIRFSDSLDAARSLIAHRFADVFWKIKRYHNIGSEALLRKCIKEVDEFVYKILKSKIEEQVQNSSHCDHGIQMKKSEDVLARLLEAKQTDTKFLRDVIINLVMAGKDTTSAVLSFFFYMMCKHPDIQEKIAKEVIEATQVNQNSSFDELAANINENTLDKMQYLHAALTETLRLYPPLPADGKVCLSDDKMPDGFRVDKGDMVLYLPYAMGRMEFLWGNDVEEFRPERWLGESGRFHQESPYKFTTFQAGPRICLGKEFAYRQMKIFCMILLASYVFRLSDENEEVKYDTSLTLAFDGGLHLLATPRVIHV
ncbi:hypothetical protein Ddye_013536 [Dipteronia dyeriana]|uniref:Cytochrome P450 n=1 Tax=Dipteronia dyeriana TaxID=168575 RepID=A0AAE0CJQ5_9ROSI|nr:hypothetical protein Ddye_013536 [Dipteronia dyeriana]